MSVVDHHHHQLFNINDYRMDKQDMIRYVDLELVQKHIHQS
jgi:hypothetical protein